MAKDAFGHGSNIRNAGLRPNPGLGNDKSFRYRTLRPGERSEGPGGRIKSGGSPQPGNTAAAAALASGPKSARVPVHDGASGPEFRPGLQPMTPDQQKTLLGRDVPIGSNKFGNGPSYADDPKLG